MHKLARPSVRANSSSPATSTAETKQQMLQTVHRWFDSLHAADHPLEDLVHRDCHLIDNTNQACYAGYKAIKHRMQVCDISSASNSCCLAHQQQVLFGWLDGLVWCVHGLQTSYVDVQTSIGFEQALG
jgi:hypothetical protein